MPGAAPCGRFDRELQRRGAAERTRRAYGVDLGQLALWSSAQRGRARRASTTPSCAATPRSSPHRGAGPRTVARKLAAIRSFYKSMVELGEMTANPADLLPAPKQPQRLPRTMKAEDVAALLNEIPATTPLELRDRALFELAYGCGLRAEELVDLDLQSIDFDAETVRVEGKGGKTRFVPAGEPALRSVTRYLERGRPALASADERARAAALQVRPAPLDVRRPPPPAGLGAPRDAAGRGPSARPPALVRDPPARGRCGFAGHSGAAGPFIHIDDPGLHSGRVGAPAGRVCPESSPGIADRGRGLETNVKAIELRDLWRRYKASGSDRAREQLVVAYSPLVKYVAGRMSSGLPAHVEEADLISYGLIGLINAIERFDPEREIKFETYAITRIKGAIIDELRALDWVPRSVRARAREIERVHGKLEHRLHRTPTDEEMARELGITVEEFQESLMKISNSTVVALDELWAVSDSSGDQVSLLDTLHDPDAPDPQELLDASELKDRLADAISALPEREKLVIALYYYENLTLREIGEVLGVTESRISQLHTKAVLRLKSRLQGDNLRD